METEQSQQTTLKNRYTEADGSAVYLLAVVGLLAVNLLAGIVAGIASGSGGKNPLDNGYFNYAVMIVMQAVNFGAVALWLKRKNTRPDYSLYNRPWLPSLAVCVVIGVVCLFGFYGLAYAFELLLETFHYQGQTNIPFNSAGEIVLGTIVTVLIAPFCEELVYRDALLSGLKRGFPTWAAILLSGAAFSLMHMNPQQTVYQFILGCTCAAVVVFSGSPWGAMVIHATNNLLAVLIETTAFGSAFGGFIEAISPNGGMTALWIIVSAVLGAGAIFGLVLLIRRFTPAPKEREYLPLDPLRESGGMLGKKSGKLFLCIGLGVCLLMWIIVAVTGFLPEGLLA